MKNILIAFMIFILSNFCLTQNQEVRVNSVKELIKNISSDKTIILETGKYILEDTINFKNDKISWIEAYDGSELFIQNVINLKITGEDLVNTKILAKPRYAFVLNFNNCENIQIENLQLGHTNGGYCEGGVLLFTSSKNISIENSILFGSGTTGIRLKDVNNFNFKESIIRKCTYDIMTIEDSKNISFSNSEFKETGEFNLINIVGKSSDISFNECTIENNSNGDYEPYLFYIEPDCKNILLENSKILNNKVPKFVNDKKKLKLIDNEFSGNSFDEKK